MNDWVYDKSSNKYTKKVLGGVLEVIFRDGRWLCCTSLYSRISSPHFKTPEAAMNYIDGSWQSRELARG